jgi:two-component system NarL family response regulator
MALRTPAVGLVLGTAVPPEKLGDYVADDTTDGLGEDVPREELLDAIRRVEAGGSYIPSAVASKFAARVTSPALTAREMDVLRLIVAGQANKEIAGLLSITEGTVKVHVAHILTKLGAADRTQAATSALKRGMVNDS